MDSDAVDPAIRLAPAARSRQDETTAGFSIRAASPADLDGIMEVQRRSPGRSTSLQFRDFLGGAITDPSVAIFVAVSGGSLIGWAATGHFDEADGAAPAGQYLMGIAVAPEFRRRGVATELVEARLDWIRRRDRVAYYFTNARNAASIALHERHGFRELGRGPRFHGVTFDGGCGILFRADLRDSRSL